MQRKTAKKKLEDLLVERSLAPDLSKARALIMAGDVVVNDQRVDKPGHTVPVDAQVRCKTSASRFVGRGGEKLIGALEDLSLVHTLQGAVVLDVGASTGGFTDVCLQAGAAKVYAVDVGTNQLAWSLRQDERVVVFEKTDIRRLSASTLGRLDWIVVDVSFIGLGHLIEHLLSFADGRSVHYLLLVKPQFELPKEMVPTGGVVLDDQLRDKAVANVQLELMQRGVETSRIVESRLPGRDGNREVFLYFQYR